MSIFPHADDEQKAEYEATRTASESGNTTPLSKPVEPVQPVEPVELSHKWEGMTNGEMLDELQRWLTEYVKTAQVEDMWTLVLWLAHTHFTPQLGTTPRLVIDSPLPESGKTTLVEHAERLCLRPVQAASLSSSALLARLLKDGPRTILIDEADRSLSPEKDGVQEFIAIINSGYKKGGTRPVLVPSKDEGWVAEEMPTYGPVLMAGNAPNLPDDTRSRCIRILLLPDIEGTVEDSDWEEIEDDAKELGANLSAWATTTTLVKPEKPKELRNRNRERWFPLLRVAETAGGEWPDRCRKLIAADLAEQREDKENGIESVPRHLQLLQDIHEEWPEGEEFWPTENMLAVLKASRPDWWGAGNQFGPLKVQGLGRLLSRHFNVKSDRKYVTDKNKPRGYYRQAFETPWRALGVTGSTGWTGSTGYREGVSDTGPETVPSLAEQFPGLSVAGLISLEGADPNLAETPEDLAAKIGCPVDIVIAELNRMEGLGNFD